ncbi:histone deacetylase [Kribbella sp. NPDC026611]|uniref:histone deacetylase n=1 Tax=Kribbella sp. NPDC026611 TaxID=3154911 RepID=UPI0033CAB143
MDRVWYVAYGSNLAMERFRCYVSGGQPSGGARMYPGCRNPTAPIRTQGVMIPGRLVFAGASKTWGGGSAFYHWSAAGEVAARAYLLTAEQLSDVAAQEMWREPGGEFAQQLTAVLPGVEELHTLGPGRYETVVRLGELDGMPMFTVTHGTVADLEPAAPSPAYLHWIRTGLREAHGWDEERIADYLSLGE